METSIAVEMTPHPDIERFIFPQAIVRGGPYRFTPENDLAKPPIIQQLFNRSDVAEVLVAENYVQITRKKNANWVVLEEAIETLLQEHFKSEASLFQENEPVEEISQETLTLPIESTPNPQTKKILFPSALVSSPQEFLDRSHAQNSPLAQSLFQISGVKALLIAPYYVSITKTDEADWPLLESKASAVLMHHLQSGVAILPESQKTPNVNSGSLTQRIQDFLAKEIRPGIALDGGDVVFLGYESGVVTLQLQGACRGCPHSAMTLNQGIERRLRAAFSEVQYVVIGAPAVAQSE